MLACQNPYLYNKDKPGRSFDYSRKSRLKSTPFPCGKCDACRAKQAKEWGNRLLLESKLHKNAVFEMTLTLSDRGLALHGPLLDMRYPRLFLKRFRINIARKWDSKLRFKYFCRGEYGSISNRPHYHLIILGLPSGPVSLKGGRSCYSPKKGRYFESEDVYLMEELAQRSWRFGHVDIKPIEEGTCHYVAGYTHKKLGQQLPAEIKDADQTRPRPQMQSGGIGINYARKTAQSLSASNTYNGAPVTVVDYGSKRIPVGRYIRNKIGYFLKMLGRPYDPYLVRLLEAAYCYYFKQFHRRDFYKLVVADCQSRARNYITPKFKRRLQHA